MKLILASRNAHKVAEVQKMLSPHGFEVTSLLSYPELADIPETGETFEENALIKARFAFKTLGIPTIADDSGICIDALNGAPGVYSKRFSNEGTDEANNALLLAKLDGCSLRSARYACAMAIVASRGEETLLEHCEGRIGTEYVGSGGFGYDPLFWPVDAPGKTMAQLTMDEKNKISHRGKAVRKLPSMLKKILY